MRQAIEASKAATKLLALSEDQRNQALNNIARELRQQVAAIVAENLKDLAAARQDGQKAAFIDRLTLTEKTIHDIAASVEAIAKQPAVVGIIDSTITTDDGLIISKQRVPIGVLAMIFESRPNVVVDCSALAIKSGNAILLKGGKEASHSNRVLYQVIQNAIADVLPPASIQLLEHRQDVTELLSQADYIDLVIPRGGQGLVSYVEANAKMPVLAHHKGLCHMFVHHSATRETINALVLNAKVQRPGVCNALETLILDERLPEETILSILKALAESGVTLRLDSSCPVVEGSELATEDDWKTEYLDLVLSVKMVSSTQEACEHIKKYGSRHTESILAEDAAAIAYFQNNVDASAVMINASTRFNDGGQFQLGAELGISTTKLHAYGPMGAREMTICRHLVIGRGHIRK